MVWINEAFKMNASRGYLFVVWAKDEDEGRVVMVGRDVLGPDEPERVQYACGEKGVDGEQRAR